MFRLYKLVFLLITGFLLLLASMSFNNESGKLFTSSLFEEFETLFEEENIGNKHLYVLPNQEATYPYKGAEIARRFYGLFESGLALALLEKDLKAFALSKVRTEGIDYFLIRLESDTGNGTIHLFEYDDNKQVISSMVTLAETDCGVYTCQQTDSWIIDLNGDTRLDILKKYALKDQLTKTVVVSNTRILLQTQEGSFEESALDEVEIEDYQLESLKFNVKGIEKQ